ncbi:MAG: hypothetical protein WC471_03020 [Candidatus Woesearchaeota archaeon]
MIIYLLLSFVLGAGVGAVICLCKLCEIFGKAAPYMLEEKAVSKERIRFVRKGKLWGLTFAGKTYLFAYVKGRLGLKEVGDIESVKLIEKGEHA